MTLGINKKSEPLFNHYSLFTRPKPSKCRVHKENHKSLETTAPEQPTTHRSWDGGTECEENSTTTHKKIKEDPCTPAP